MYDFKGFGQRLQKLRKGKQMTQEELAERLGISGQAVSKWENDQSYPDITIIPDIAEILSTDIHFLFGKKADAGNAPANFPETYKNMPLVHFTTKGACYSSKTVASHGNQFSDYAKRGIKLAGSIKQSSMMLEKGRLSLARSL